MSELTLARHYLQLLAETEETIQAAESLLDRGVTDPQVYQLLETGYAMACAYYSGAVDAGSERQARMIMKVRNV